MKYRTDLILGEVFCIFIFYFLDSGFSVLNGLQFYFWLRDSENPQCCSKSLRDILACFKSLVSLSTWALRLAFSSARAVLSFSSYVTVSLMLSYFVCSVEIDSNACLSCSLSGRSLSSRILSSFPAGRAGMSHKFDEISRKIQQSQQYSEPILINGDALEVVESAKLLGLNISSDLTWNININEIFMKASKRLYFLVQLKRAKVTRTDLGLFYRLVVDQLWTMQYRPFTSVCLNI